MLTGSSGAAEIVFSRNYVTAFKKGDVYYKAAKMKSNAEEM